MARRQEVPRHASVALAPPRHVRLRRGPSPPRNTGSFAPAASSTAKCFAKVHWRCLTGGDYGHLRQQAKLSPSTPRPVTASAER
ncbi:MAG: hypothetical protein R2873_26015 [Caldilineaceae bacterium]